MLKKLENTNKSTKPSEDIITSSEHGEPEESFQCEICEMKANCKVSLGKHKQKEHITIPQLDGGGYLGDNDPSILPPGTCSSGMRRTLMEALQKLLWYTIKWEGQGGVTFVTSLANLTSVKCSPGTTMR